MVHFTSTDKYRPNEKSYVYRLDRPAGRTVKMLLESVELRSVQGCPLVTEFLTHTSSEEDNNTIRAIFTNIHQHYVNRSDITKEWIFERVLENCLI